jgi:APA family basic amino acid/polyamine antiporter
MFALGAIVIVAGFSFDQGEFAAAVLEREGVAISAAPPGKFQWGTFLAASALLFASFIGFDSIAQAGGEARNPARSLPLAIFTAVTTVGTFYLLFTAAVYHAVPWSFIAERAQTTDLTAPGLLSYLLSPGWSVAIVAGAAIALINDLPAMLLAVSRLMFAWAEDGVFPQSVSKVHPQWHTPHVAIVLSGLMATVGILGSHLAGDFFLGVDVLVTSMLVNFLVMCLSVLSLPRNNPELAAQIKVARSPKIRNSLAVAGVLFLGGFLIIHIWKDLTTSVEAWYFHSTYVWLLVMVVASVIFWREVGSLRRAGVDTQAIFAQLPPE